MLNDLLQTLDYQAKNPALFEQALTHKSFSADHNERLEYLGDAVLDLVIGEALYLKWPEMREGQLSRFRSELVNGQYLAQKASALGFSDYLRLGTGERKTGGAERESILADAFEAVLGALYLDAGYNKTQQVILQLFQHDLADFDKKINHKDAKTQLQELMQKHRYDLPEYRLVKTTGKDHQRSFTISCYIRALDISSTETAPSKKAAEQKAATEMLSLLQARKLA